MNEGMERDAGHAGCRDREGAGRFDRWWEERSIGEKVVLVIGFVILGAGLLFLFGYIVMLLWNWLMPEIFALRTLSYWQAWGILALSCILFGRMGGSGVGGSSDRKRRKELLTCIREHQADGVKGAPATTGAVSS